MKREFGAGHSKAALSGTWKRKYQPPECLGKGRDHIQSHRARQGGLKGWECMEAGEPWAPDSGGSRREVVNGDREDQRAQGCS